MTTPAPSLASILTAAEEHFPLDLAALAVARLHHDAVDEARVAGTLDDWAKAIGDSLPRGAGGLQYLSSAHRFLFVELGLRGDRDDYFAPENSCLDLVMERRRGLPITLSVIYLEVARRLLRPVHGIALPGHFLCQYDDGLIQVLVDVFHEGRLLLPGDALALVEAATGRPMPDEPLKWKPAPRGAILTRMMLNLRNAYLRRGDFGGVERVDAQLAVLRA